MKALRVVSLILLCVWIAACASRPTTTGRLPEPVDGPPAVPLDPDRIKDAVPRRDPVTRAGNTSPYTVFGRTYTVMPVAQAQGYRSRGLASWYGTKFHGRPTANGEIYDMNAMTAAHRSLPIPAYVRVTNLENGRTAVVRVNDRGPFHQDRIIDLSYAAAVRLGFDRKGTALVEIEVVDVDNVAPVQLVGTHYLQAGAFQSRVLAENLQRRLEVAVDYPVRVLEAADNPGIHRVRIGPVADRVAAERLRSRLLAEQLADAHIISE